MKSFQGISLPAFGRPGMKSAGKFGWISNFAVLAEITFIVNAAITLTVVESYISDDNQHIMPK